MDTATLLTTVRRRAGLTQRELARRARTSAAAVCQYERGERVPRVDTLQRLVAATGAVLRLDVPPPASIDLRRNGRDFADVLTLVDALPRREYGALAYPPLRQLLARS